VNPRYNIFLGLAKPNQAKRQLRLFIELDFFIEPDGVLRVLLQKLSNARGVFLFLWDYVAVNATECQMLAITRQFPNHVSILAIIGVEILDARKRCLCNVGVISTDAEKKPGRERPLEERTITRPTKSKPISEKTKIER